MKLPSMDPSRWGAKEPAGGWPESRSPSKKASSQSGPTAPPAPKKDVACSARRSRRSPARVPASRASREASPGLAASGLCCTMTSTRLRAPGSRASCCVKKSAEREPAGTRSVAFRPTGMAKAAQTEKAEEATNSESTEQRTAREVVSPCADERRQAAQHLAREEPGRSAFSANAGAQGATEQRPAKRRRSSRARTATKKVVWKAKSATMPTLA
mmetsp:Transcript_118555/g.369285  ORF Transcript_118555/g.369285 Transcript_118555/m.369285 type:complete len:214 (-) Transcript_118555:128-769(-)